MLEKKNHLLLDGETYRSRDDLCVERLDDLGGDLDDGLRLFPPPDGLLSEESLAIRLDLCGGDRELAPLLLPVEPRGSS